MYITSLVKRHSCALFSAPLTLERFMRQRFGFKTALPEDVLRQIIVIAAECKPVMPKSKMYFCTQQANGAVCYYLLLPACLC